MITKTITYEQLVPAIKTVFAEDKAVYDLYDPNVEVKNIDDIVANILQKTTEYKAPVIYKEVYLGNELAGYFFYREGMLISFGLNVKFRTRHYKKDFFRTIKKEIGSHFFCVLWTKNSRAIRYLLKMGMQIKIPSFIFNGHSLTQLIN